jgi:hypothetical protein
MQALLRREHNQERGDSDRIFDEVPIRSPLRGVNYFCRSR